MPELKAELDVTIDHDQINALLIDAHVIEHAKIVPPANFVCAVFAHGDRWHFVFVGEKDKVAFRTVQPASDYNVQEVHAMFQSIKQIMSLNDVQFPSVVAVSDPSDN